MLSEIRIDCDVQSNKEKCFYFGDKYLCTEFEINRIMLLSGLMHSNK